MGKKGLPYLRWYPQHSAYHTVGLKQYALKKRGEMERRADGRERGGRKQGKKEGRIIEVQTRNCNNKDLQ